MPFTCVTRPVIDPGADIATFTVVATFAATEMPLRTSFENPLADTRTSYVPGSRLEIRYEPSVALVAVALMMPVSTACTVAPASADPPVARVMAPPIVPVVITVNVNPLLPLPPAVTTTGPVAAPAGTTTPMLVLFQLVMVVTGVVLNVTLPCVVPKVVPVMVTLWPTAAPPGLMLEMCGRAVNVEPLLGGPLTVTTTGPGPGGTEAGTDA